MTNNVEQFDEAQHNPLDSVEDVLNDHNWVYRRATSEQLIVEVSGNSCCYKVLFFWQESLNTLKISCHYDIKINNDNNALVAMTIMDLNTQLWMGHFEIDKNTQEPCFRYACLLHGNSDEKWYNHIEDLVDISLTQCERFQHVFHILSEKKDANVQTLSLAMMDTLGES